MASTLSRQQVIDRMQAKLQANGETSVIIVPDRNDHLLNRRTPHASSPITSCVHRGVEVRQQACATCQGAIQIKVFACDVLGECTIGKKLDGIACCKDGAKRCEKFEGPTPNPPHRRDESFCYAVLPDFPPVTVRNLICHVWPALRNDSWRDTVSRIIDNIDLFNGRRIIGIVTDEATHAASVVKDAFFGYDVEFIELTNNPALREVVTLIPMLEAVESKAENEATFWCHVKGVTRGEETQCHRWRDVMFDSCLDWDAVAAELSHHPAVGTFKKVGRGFTSSDNFSTSDWHYSGSFWWFRNAELFRRHWRKVDQIPYGVEPYPSLHFSVREAGALTAEGSVPEMNLYRKQYWDAAVDPLLRLRNAPS